MKKGVSQLLSVIPVFILPQVRADVAPPGGLIVLSLGLLVALGCIVVIIVAVLVVVIRAIRKNHTHKDNV